MRRASYSALCLAGLTLAVAIGLSGCWRPVNELGTIHTPMPTPPGAERQVRLSPEKLHGLVIPLQCVHEMPLAVYGIVGFDLSPDGEWLVGQGYTRFSLGTPYPFAFFHNLETRESRLLPRSVYSDTNFFGFHGSYSWDGQSGGVYYRSVERDELYHLRLSDGRVRVVEKCAGCVDVDVAEPLGLAAYIRVGEGKRVRPRWLEVRQWNNGVSAGVLVTVPVPAGSYAVRLSPTGKRAAYWGEKDEIVDAQGYEWSVAPLYYVDLSNGTRIKLKENDLGDPWVTDDVVLEPDRDTLRVWKYNLATGQRELFVEFLPETLMYYKEELSEGKRFAIASAMIGGRNRQYLLFQWRLARTNQKWAPLMVADLRCALERAKYTLRER